MSKSYFDTRKHKLLPWINDFTDPQDQIRFEKNVNKLSYKEWFWLHPTSYNLVLYGGPSITIVTMAAVIVFFVNKGLGVLSFIPAFLMVISLLNLIKKIKNKEINKNMTFYDLYMREY